MKLYAVTSAFCLLLATGCGKPAAPAPPPPLVDVAPVIQKDVPVTREWVANVDGFVNAQIQPQVSGYLLRQTYREGSFVKKGQVLFEIDSKPLQATLEQAQGQLAQARAQLVKAQQDVDRAESAGWRNPGTASPAGGSKSAASAGRSGANQFGLHQSAVAD